MVTNISYTKTFRGERAFTKQLPDAVGQVLALMVEDLTEDEIFNRLHDVNHQDFKSAMTWLLEGGFIKLTDTEPFTYDVESAADEMQVDEISIDEFTNSNESDEAEKSAITETKRVENKAKLETLSNAVKEAKKKVAEQAASKLKAEAEAKKEQERLAAIAAAKTAAAAKARETARLQSEAEAEKAAEINAKKEEWAKLKFEAEEKEKAEEKSRIEAELKRKADIQAEKKEKIKAEEKEKANKWMQLKMEAKTKAEEDARLQKLAKAETEIQQQREANNMRSKSFITKWFNRFLLSIKSLFIFAVTVLGFLLIAMHFINIPMLIKPLEEIVSTHLQDEVNIQSVHIWLYPKPHLLLKDLTAVNTVTIHAQKIRIYPDYINLKEKFYDHLNVPYKVQSIQVDDLSVDQQELSHLKAWAKATSPHAQYQINKIIFKNTALNFNVMKLPLLNGEVLLDEAGLLTQASLQTANKDFKLEVNYAKDSYLVDVDATNWQAPFLSKPLITQLTATGVIKKSNLILSSITGRLYDGNLTGSLKTNLASPALTTKGDYHLTNIVINNIPNDLALHKSLSGILNSRGYFSFSLDSHLNQIKKMKLNSAFTVSNGVLKKVDIVSAMRNRNLNGSTNFSKLSGNISLSNKRYQFSKLILQDNQLQATGQVSMSANNHVAATVSSNIAIRNDGINTDLIIEGPLTALKVKN